MNTAANPEESGNAENRGVVGVAVLAAFACKMAAQEGS